MTGTLRARHCLVTGGAGFIGSHLVESLLAEGHQVRVLDNLSTGSLENLAACRNQIEFLEGDIRHPDTVRQACEGIETVFHQAAITSVTQSIQHPAETLDVNVTGTRVLLEAARNAGVDTVVFASSAAVYGAVTPRTQALPLLEESPLQPTSPYGLSKKMGEELCALYTELYGLNTLCLRYFNVYGPRQQGDSQYSGVITRFINRLIEGEAPVIYGDGAQSRDFISIRDVVRANLLALQPVGPQETPRAEILNVASQQATSLLDILDYLKPFFTAIPPQFQPERRGDVRHSMGGNQKIRQYLAAPMVPLAEGLKEFVAWIRQEHPPAKGLISFSDPSLPVPDQSVLFTQTSVKAAGTPKKTHNTPSASNRLS